MFVLIGQNLHGTVADIDQVDQHFNPFAASHHIAAERPESFLLIVAYFNIPYADILEMPINFLSDSMPDPMSGTGNKLSAFISIHKVA